MKKYLRRIRIKPQIALLLLLALAANSVFANNDSDPYSIIITGQLTNTEYGNPLVGHPVYIKSETVAYSSNYYFKLLYTDEDGFFYDTISTQFNYGSMEVYTYDHDGVKNSEVLHFRFMDLTNSNLFLVNFHIYMPLQTPVLQAKFKYIKKMGGDKFRYKFIDQTEADNILSWYWEFGDGTTSELPNPDHVYSDFGMYRVNLRVVADINGNEVISLISQYVYIPQINYYHLGGHCLANEFPIDEGEAVLYQVNDDNVLIPFDTTALNDTLGHYYFYQVPEGNYCVKTQPDRSSEFYGEMVPTYYGDSEFWKAATIINLDHTDYSYHVNLQPSTGVPGGEGKIAGKIIFTNTDRNGKEYNSKGVTVYLLDALNKPLAYQYTDGNSSFSFDNLAMGTYWVYPEVAGFNLNKEAIQLTNIIPVIKDVEILINTDAVYLIFPDSEDLEDNYVSQPYPNPANDQFNFEINAKNNKDMAVYLTDIQGRIVLSKTVSLKSGLNKNTINTADLKPGMYFLKLDANGIYRERKILINR